MMTQRSSQRLAFGRQAFELRARLIQHASDFMTRRGQRILRLTEVVRGKELKRIRRVVGLAKTACRAHLGCQDQKVAAGLQQDPADVGSRSRNDAAGFVVGCGENFLPHPRQIPRLFTPGVALGAIVVNQRRDLADRSGVLLVLRV
jgi:hypothetical protein